MKLKIGIITYHRAKNLGAMLQSYALQKTLEKYKGECEIIDYRNEKIEESYKLKKTRECRTLKEKIKNILFMKKSKAFEIVRKEFNEKVQKLSTKEYNKRNIIEANNNYDLFITGSDQVWNLKLNYGDENYFLDFVIDDKKKNSYAASFGTNKIDEEQKAKIYKQLNKFNKISVREEEGKKFIEEITGKNSELVLDPTLLLNKYEWENIINNEKIEKGKYIFVYIIAYTPTLLEFARKLGKEKKCKVICFHTSYQKYRGMKNLTKVSPQDFLNYVKNAEAVVTSSFHGMCFSINLQKEFYYELDENKVNNNSRLKTLAATLNLEDRRIINGKCTNNTIDYNEVTRRLDAERKRSIRFIEELGEENG